MHLRRCLDQTLPALVDGHVHVTKVRMICIVALLCFPRSATVGSPDPTLPAVLPAVRVTVRRVRNGFLAGGQGSVFLAGGQGSNPFFLRCSHLGSSLMEHGVCSGACQLEGGS